MRRRLLAIAVAASTLVVLAFAVPLAILVREVIDDRAVTSAERDAAALVPILALTDDATAIGTAIGRTETGRRGHLTVWLPESSSGETLIGDPAGTDVAALDLARRGRTSFAQSRGDDLDLFTPVLLSDGEVAVIRAQVPSSRRRDGVVGAWATLAGVALVLVAGSALVADRLARRMTVEASTLAGTARALAGGDRGARAASGTTPELADAAHALNLLADRIDELRAAERERVADLSHRLRTPLTALRLDAEATGVPAISDGVDRLEAAVTDLIQAARRPLHDGSTAAICDAAEVVRERATFWSALADEDGRSWHLDVEDGPAFVFLDTDSLAAALDAVLANVFSHTPAETAYWVGLAIVADRVRITVDDEGSGIPDPSSALDRGHSGGPSTGLGLDIAARAAESGRGTLDLTRSPGGGTRVLFDLPRGEGSLRAST